MRFGPSRLVQCLPRCGADIFRDGVAQPTVTLPRQDGPWVDLKLRVPNCGAAIFRDNVPQPTVTLPRGRAVGGFEITRAELWCGYFPRQHPAANHDAAASGRAVGRFEIARAELWCGYFPRQRPATNRDAAASG